MGATRTAPALRSSLAERASLTRPRHPPLVIAIAIATLASGLLNLYSLIQPSLSSRLALLYQIFPLEFVQLSRFLTLVLGFALVISSFNVFRRKRRAFQVVAVLAVLSIVFHLTKGVDYEEASSRSCCSCCSPKVDAFSPSAAGSRRSGLPPSAWELRSSSGSAMACSDSGCSTLVSSA